MGTRQRAEVQHKIAPGKMRHTVGHTATGTKNRCATKKKSRFCLLVPLAKCDHALFCRNACNRALILLLHIWLLLLLLSTPRTVLAKIQYNSLFPAVERQTNEFPWTANGPKRKSSKVRRKVACVLLLYVVVRRQLIKVLSKLFTCRTWRPLALRLLGRK